MLLPRLFFFVLRGLTFYQKALSIDIELGHKLLEGARYTTVSRAYIGMCQFDKAIEGIKKALSISLEMGDKIGEAVVYRDFSDVYEKMHQPIDGIEFHQKALAIAIQRGNRELETGCFMQDKLPRGSLHQRDIRVNDVVVCEDHIESTTTHL